MTEINGFWLQFEVSQWVVLLGCFAGLIIGIIRFGGCLDNIEARLREIERITTGDDK